jgi:flagellar protein FliO/FliZ
MIPDIGTVLGSVVALSIVLVLIVSGAWVARRGGLMPRPPAGRELAVVEAIALDSRRRLHLVRCGDHQALLLTGGPQDVVVGWVPRQPSDTVAGL